MTNLNIETVANQPTTNSGELRAKDWTTLLANSINNGELVVEQFDDHVTASYDNVSYELDLPVLFCASLMPAFRNEVSISDCLNYLAEGCLSSRMLAVKNHIEEKGATLGPVSKQGRVLTASEYLTNCYIMALDKKSLDSVTKVMNIANKLSDKNTKIELLACLNQFKEIFITEKQAETYEIMEEADRQDALKFQGLTDANFKNIVRRGPVLTAEIDVSESKTGLAKLVELGFNLVSSTFNSDTMTINVTFDESEVQSI